MPFVPFKSLTLKTGGPSPRHSCGLWPFRWGLTSCLGSCFKKQALRSHLQGPCQDWRWCLFPFREQAGPLLGGLAQSWPHRPPWKAPPPPAQSWPCAPHGAADQLSLRSSYNEFYFLTHPALFIEDHFPDNKNWQLLKPPQSLRQFENNMYHKSEFYNKGMLSAHPATPVIRTGNPGQAAGAPAARTCLLGAPRCLGPHGTVLPGL